MVRISVSAFVVSCLLLVSGGMVLTQSMKSSLLSTTDTDSFELTPFVADEGSDSVGVRPTRDPVPLRLDVPIKGLLAANQSLQRVWITHPTPCVDLAEGEPAVLPVGSYLVIERRESPLQKVELLVSGPTLVRPQWVRASDVVWGDSRCLRLQAALSAVRSLPLWSTPQHSATFRELGVGPTDPVGRIAPREGVLLPLLEEVAATQNTEADHFKVLASGLTSDEARLPNSTQCLSEKCDLLFVIDDTYSGGYLRSGATMAMRALHRGLIQRGAYAPQDSTATWGVLLFTDYVPGLVYEPNKVSKFLWGDRPLASPQQLLVALDRAVTSEVSSVDFEEAVLDGLWAGIERYQWRTESGVERVIILVSDAPSHPVEHVRNPYRLSVKNIIQRARAKGIQLLSLYADGGGGQAIQAEHIRQLTELTQQTGGGMASVGDYEQLVAALTRPQAPLASTPNATWQVGWLPGDFAEQELFESGWLLTHEQLQFLRMELTGLLPILARSESQAAPTGFRSSLFLSRSHVETLGALLRRAGIPIRAASLQFSPADLLSIDAEQRQQLRTSVEGWLSGLQSGQYDEFSQAWWLPASALP